MPPLAASNPRIRRLRRLSGRRAARQEEGAFVLEGPQLLREALAAAQPIEAVYCEAGSRDPSIERAREAGVVVHEVESGVITGISDVVTPRPVLAVAPIRAADPAVLLDSALRRQRPVLILVELRDPGNLGTILRAAEAAGAAGVICTRGSVDPWSPKAVRSSVGAILHVEVASGIEALEVLDAVRAAGIRRVGTVVAGGAPYDSVELRGAVALVVGNEAHGLPEQLAGEVDLRVSIPMEGRMESLNAAMAATILCYEALRQRRVGGTDWTAPPHGDKVIRP